MTLVLTGHFGDLLPANARSKHANPLRKVDIHPSRHAVSCLENCVSFSDHSVSVFLLLLHAANFPRNHK